MSALASPDASTDPRHALELRTRDIGEGATAVLVGSALGGFRVSREVAGASATVIETPYRDEAESVFGLMRAADPPWHGAYLPVGKCPPAHADLTVRVHAVGATAEACCEAFAESIGDALDPASLAVEGVAGPDFQWFARFSTLREGTSFKAAGRRVPGGCVMTWWK